MESPRNGIIGKEAGHEQGHERQVRQWNRDVPRERVMLSVVRSFDGIRDENLRLKARLRELADTARRLARMTMRHQAAKAEAERLAKKCRRQKEAIAAYTRQNQLLETEVGNLRKEIRDMYDRHRPTEVAQPDPIPTAAGGGWATLRQRARELFRV